MNKVESKGFYPTQCNCGHIFLEKYQFSEPTKEGYIGFCWCGWCKTKLMVKPFVKKCLFNLSHHNDLGCSCRVA